MENLFDLLLIHGNWNDKISLRFIKNGKKVFSFREREKTYYYYVEIFAVKQKCFSHRNETKWNERTKQNERIFCFLFFFLKEIYP